MCRHQPYHNRCILLPLAALLTGFVALAAPSRGQVINEDLKLLAIQGQTHDNFGFSIAIDNGVVAVGAYLGDDNGSDNFSATLRRTNRRFGLEWSSLDFRHTFGSHLAMNGAGRFFSHSRRACR